MIAQLLRTNPAPISAVALIIGFALIVSGYTPWGTAVGAVLTLLAFLVPFARPVFVARSVSDPSEQMSVRPRDASPIAPAEIQSSVSAEMRLRQDMMDERSDAERRAQYLTELISIVRTALAREADPKAVMQILDGLEDVEIKELARRSQALHSLLAESTSSSETPRRRRAG